MRFTERELTVAVDELAKQFFVATLPRRRRVRDDQVDEAWRELKAMDKYHHRTAVADTVLPALIALPDRPTVGEAPTFTDAELTEAAESGLRQRLDAHEPGAYDALPDKQRRALLGGAVELTRAAVAAMPIRQDPDAFEVPDHL